MIRHIHFKNCKSRCEAVLQFLYLKNYESSVYENHENLRSDEIVSFLLNCKKFQWTLLKYSIK